MAAQGKTSGSSSSGGPESLVATLGISMNHGTSELETILPEMFSKASGRVNEVNLEFPQQDGHEDTKAIAVQSREKLLEEWKHGAAAAEQALPLIGTKGQRTELELEMMMKSQ